jgi:hypothetical protein
MLTYKPESPSNFSSNRPRSGQKGGIDKTPKISHHDDETGTTNKHHLAGAMIYTQKEKKFNTFQKMK